LSKISFSSSLGTGSRSPGQTPLSVRDLLWQGRGGELAQAIVFQALRLALFLCCGELLSAEQQINLFFRLYSPKSHYEYTTSFLKGIRSNWQIFHAQRVKSFGIKDCFRARWFEQSYFPAFSTAVLGLCEVVVTIFP